MAAINDRGWTQSSPVEMSVWQQLKDIKSNTNIYPPNQYRNEINIPVTVGAPSPPFPIQWPCPLLILISVEILGLNLTAISLSLFWLLQTISPYSVDSQWQCNWGCAPVTATTSAAEEGVFIPSQDIQPKGMFCQSSYTCFVDVVLRGLYTSHVISHPACPILHSG